MSLPVKQEPPEEGNLASEDSNITISVDRPNGQTGRSFSVNRKRICEVSPIFEAIFKDQPHIKETNIKGDPEVFNRVVLWTYSGKISSDEKPVESLDLIDLWIMADQLLIPKIQNIAMKGLLFPAGLAPGTRQMDVHEIYNNTKPGSALRRILIAWLVSGNNFRADWDYEGVSHEILVDMLRKIGKDAAAGMEISPGKPEDYLVSEDGDVKSPAK